MADTSDSTLETDPAGELPPGTGAAAAAAADVPPVGATLSVRRRNLAFATIAMGMLLAALDSTIISTALPTIVGDLGGAEHMSWVVTAYMLTQTIATILAGKFGDLYGRKTIFQISCLIFVVASFLCGFAHSMTWLISMRAVQGIGGGGLTVTATAVIADIIPLRERGKYQGAIGAVFGVTTVIGPLLGGIFTDDLSWHWAFYVNVPIGIGVIILAQSTLPAIKAVARPIIDYLGIAFVALGSGSLILATSWGGVEYPWASWQIIGLFVAAVVLLATFVLVELRAGSPVLPMRLFRGRVFSVCAVLAFVVGFALLGAMTFLPSYLQYVLGVSATVSGLRTLPMVIGLLIASISAGNVVGRTGKYKLFPLAGSAVMAVGLFLLSRMDASTTFWGTSLAMLVLGFGIGLSMQVLTIIVQNTSDYSDLGVATSGVTFFRTMGSAFGASAFGTIYANHLKPGLAKAVIAHHINPALVTNPGDVHRLPAAQHAPVVQVYVDAIQTVFAYAIPVAVAALVLAIFLPQVQLRGISQDGAAEMGPGFGMPDQRSSAGHLEAGVARILRTRLTGAAAEILAASDSSLDESQLWCLRHVGLQQLTRGGATLDAVAVAVKVPSAVLAPAFADAIHSGLLREDHGELERTELGQREFDKVADSFFAWLAEQIEQDRQHPAGRGRGVHLEGPDRESMQAALRSIAHQLAEESDDDSRLLPAAT